MNTFKLIVSSPDGNIFEGDVIKFDVRGVEGDIGIMAGHIPFVTSIVDGECSVWFDDDTNTIKTTSALTPNYSPVTTNFWSSISSTYYYANIFHSREMKRCR